MSPGKFTLNSVQLSRQFPFYILLNADFSISCTGNSLAKLTGTCAGNLFTSHFFIKGREAHEVSFASLKAATNQLVIIEIINERRNQLKGAFEFLEDSNQLLFTGSLWLDSLQELNNLILTSNDFAHHDSVIDLLHLLQVQELVNTDLKELLEKVSQQKKALHAASSQNQLIAASLKESNQRFSYVSRATSDAIWDWNIAKNTIYRAEGFEKLFGYYGADVTERMHFWKEKIHPEDADDIVSGINDILGSDAVNWSREYRFKKSDGNYAYVLDKGFVVRGEQNEPLRMVGAMQDITAKKEEEMRLKLLESVITNIQEAVIILEPLNNSAFAEGRITYTNPAFTEMTGYTSEEIKGQSPLILLGTDSDAAAFKSIVDAVARQVHVETDMVHYKKSREAHWVNVSLNPVVDKNGILTHWIGIHRDITASKKASEEMVSQKKFWEDILNNLPSDLCVCDGNHNYLFMNHHGIKDAATREWIIGKNDFDFFRMRGDDDTLAMVRRNHFNRAIESRSAVEWLEETIKPDGGNKYVMRRYYPYYESENLKFVIGYSIDITDRKVAEIKMNEALVAMQKSNDDLEQFAYVTSHDLQEPLRMVSGFLTLLEKKYNAVLDENGKQYIRFAVDGAKRMQQLILDLLDYSRVGRTEEKLEQVDLNQLMNEIVSLYTSSIAEKNATITYSDLPVLRILKAPLRQVFQNLIGNSLKYTDELTKPQITVSAKDCFDRWEFAFNDNGIGIEPQHFERIFVIFQRLHNRQKFSGTGIGLAITKKIVENFGGTIWLESELGKGSTFYLSIPKHLRTNGAIG